MIIHHVIWPEGLPDQAKSTNSWWNAHWQKLKFQMYYLAHPLNAHRVRHAISEESLTDPHAAEEVLQAGGGIAPPGGWPQREAGFEPRRIPADSRIVTHSVV